MKLTEEDDRRDDEDRPVDWHAHLAFEMGNVLT